jgi:membrane peptidoglycan carboxypeptidase
MAHRLGIESPLNPVPSIALGAEAVSPFEMAAAYSTIANYGEKVEPYLIERIETVGGEVIYDHRVHSEQVIDASMAAAVVSTLEKVVCCGTATRADIDRPQAGKTGTAQNYRDVWFVGFIPQFTTAVWSGYPDAQVELSDFTVYNEPAGVPQYYDRAFGGTLPAPIWAQFMKYITADLPVEDFPEPPDGFSEWFRIPKTTVPDVSGMSREEAESAIAKAGLIPSLVDTPSTQPEGTFLGQSPTAGAEVSQGSTVTVRYSSGIPPVAPNLIGLSEGEVGDVIAAYNEESGLTLSYVVRQIPVLNRANVGIVVRTDPGPGAPVAEDGVITVYVGELHENGGGGGGGGDGGGGGGDGDGGG